MHTNHLEYLAGTQPRLGGLRTALLTGQSVPDSHLWLLSLGVEVVNPQVTSFGAGQVTASGLPAAQIPDPHIRISLGLKVPGSCSTTSTKYLLAPTVGVHNLGTDLGKVENLLRHVLLSAMVARWSEPRLRGLGTSQTALVTKGRDVLVCFRTVYQSWQRSVHHSSLRFLLHSLPRLPSDLSLLSCTHSSLRVSSRPQRGITRPSWL